MSILLNETQSYINRTLDVQTFAEPMDLRVPHVIKDIFDIFELTVPMEHSPNFSVILLIEVGQEYAGIVRLAKMIALARQVAQQPVVYVCSSLTPVERRSLIDHGVNFIQIGYQMFLPELGMDLRQHYRTRKPLSASKPFTPAAQATLLQSLYRGWMPGQMHTSGVLKGDQDYSRVTLSKVIEQFQGAGLIELAEGEGHTNQWVFKGDSKAIFERALPSLCSPVKQKLGITTPLGSEYAVLAGESALDAYTMLCAPSHPVYAMTRQQLDVFIRLGAFEVVEDIDAIKAWVEVWSYDPLQQAKGRVDCASLLLSLMDVPDERVQIALDDLRAQVEWL
ncbi:hypothetical protein IFT48_02920 [Pseudomonas fluorescens]|uniref:hypothetical protein n=1 Tax=Pseudomonas TaxID=286 RepID=UPI000F02D9A8|nr:MULTISPECIES: hypothetical protein [Pseudomonas]MBD8088919.1 hypothetical protein [Pseudomonas fluorescens]MBD8681698.1 hypothetical protein [Pseudomonas sp. CFBP 13719]